MWSALFHAQIRWSAADVRQDEASMSEADAKAGLLRVESKS